MQRTLIALALPVRGWPTVISCMRRWLWRGADFHTQVVHVIRRRQKEAEREDGQLLNLEQASAP